MGRVEKNLRLPSNTPFTIFMKYPFGHWFDFWDSKTHNGVGFFFLWEATRCMLFLFATHPDALL